MKESDIRVTVRPYLVGELVAVKHGLIDVRFDRLAYKYTWEELRGRELGTFLQGLQFWLLRLTAHDRLGDGPEIIRMMISGADGDARLEPVVRFLRM